MTSLIPVYQSRSYFFNDIFTTEHTPAGPVKGVFVLLHGFPAWVTKNYDIGELLALEGYKVYIPHHQGLGQSPGEFRFLENLKAVRHFLTLIKEIHSDLRLSLLGHSWGGYLALQNLDLLNDRLILLAPLALFPIQDRRQALISALYHNNVADLTAYTLESLEEEFQQLEMNLNYGPLLEVETAPKSLLLYGTNDEIIPPDLIRDFAFDVRSNRFTTVAFADDHRLSKRRPVLEKIRQWIQEQ